MLIRITGGTMLLLLIACTPQPNADGPGAIVPDRGSSPGTTTLASRCAAGDASCLDMLTVPLLWTVEPPWTGLSIHDAGDVNGDGIPDVQATVWMEDGTNVSHSSFLFGPVDRPVSIPSGEDLGLPNGPWMVSDVTGDGQTDLLRRAGPVLAGPVDTATTEADAIGTVPDASLVDLDGDGDLDVTAGADDRVELWLGSWTGWQTDPPTATLLLEPCDPDRDRAQAWPIEDLDLDGVDEWWVGASIGCPHYQVPADTVGEVDVPSTFPEVPWQSPIPVGDQNGDGFTDHQVLRADGPEVLAAPMSYAIATGWTGQSLGSLPEIAGNGLSPLGQSVVGDDYDDFSTAATAITDPSAGEHYVLLEGGPGGDAFAGVVSRTLYTQAHRTGPEFQFIGEFIVSVEATGARVTPIPADW